MEYTQEEIKEAFTKIHVAAVMNLKNELIQIQGLKGKEDRVKFIEEQLEQMKIIYIPKLK